MYQSNLKINEETSKITKEQFQMNKLNFFLENSVKHLAKNQINLCELCKKIIVNICVGSSFNFTTVIVMLLTSCLNM